MPNVIHEELPGYDPSYRHGTNPAIDLALNELNAIVMPFGGGIACLDEKGERVQRYTDRVVLELPSAIPNAVRERARAAAQRVLAAMDAN